jgi:hypothetical protein
LSQRLHKLRLYQCAGELGEHVHVRLTAPGVRGDEEDKVRGAVRAAEIHWSA